MSSTMVTSFLLSPANDSSSQDQRENSFIGGIPKLLPGAEIPTCTYCGAGQTFFFQVAFPPGMHWSGLSIAVFACTSCADENRLIPEMLIGQLFGTDIPEGFLSSYQRNFRFLVFNTCDSRLIPNYLERIAFRRFVFLPCDDPQANGTKIGGVPSWILDDETPGSYAGQTKMVFLFQLAQGLTFPTVPGALPQIQLSLSGRPTPSTKDYYELFLGNQVYLFGTTDTTDAGVYAVTQID